MAFPTNIVKRRLIRAAGWSLALHVALLWPALALLTPVGGVSSKSARLDGRLRGASTSAPIPNQATEPVRQSVLSGRRGRRQLSEAVATRQAKVPPRIAKAPADESEGLDADVLRAYRLALAIKARPYWRYPVEAQQAGQGGVVEVRVTFSSNGRAWVSLEQSSGYRLLDDAAQEMLRAALADTRQPEALRGKAFVLPIPVVFDPGGEAGR